MTLKRLGIEVTFVDAAADEQEIKRRLPPRPRRSSGETIANPAITVAGYERWRASRTETACRCRELNTFPFPLGAVAVCLWGEDIIIHSTTKYMDGHAVQVGGAIVDSGTFDWGKRQVPGLVGGYHHAMACATPRTLAAGGV